jgi:hypothetical protein
MGDKAPALLIGFGKAAAGDEEGDEDAGALAGKALAKAIKSGDGQAIYEAFESLLTECESKDVSDEPEEDDKE